jgi:hypothetical protein
MEVIARQVQRRHAGRARVPFLGIKSAAALRLKAALRGVMPSCVLFRSARDLRHDPPAAASPRGRGCPYLRIVVAARDITRNVIENPIDHIRPSSAFAELSRMKSQ